MKEQGENVQEVPVVQGYPQILLSSPALLLTSDVILAESFNIFALMFFSEIAGWRQGEEEKQ